MHQRILVGSLLFFSISAHSNENQTTPPPCGRVGTVSERIADCHTQQELTPLKFSWSLVTRNDFQNSRWPIEVWRDDTTKLLWGERFRDDSYGYIFSFKEARHLCKNSVYLPFGGELTANSWYLPTAEDYRTAESHGLTIALKLFPDSYWTSTPEEVESIMFSRGGALFASMERKIISTYKIDRYSVRCVAGE